MASEIFGHSSFAKLQNSALYLQLKEILQDNEKFTFLGFHCILVNNLRSEELTPPLIRRGGNKSRKVKIMFNNFICSKVYSKSANILFNSYIFASIWWKPLIKELNLCHKIEFYNPFIFAAWWLKLRLYYLAEFIVWNTKGLRHCFAKL